MSLTKACCTIPPVESNYTPKGKETKLGDLVIYETGDLENDRVLICFYDIFGFHPVTKQFCDKLGASGFKVVMPDFFKGKPFPSENFPPEDRQILMDFIGTSGSWEKVVKGEFLQLIKHYKATGAKKIGVFGFCWGAKMSVEASGDYPDEIAASILIHPALVDAKDADRIKSPTLLLPAKDDGDLLPLFEKLKEKFGESGCGHHRFEDVSHGFCAARGDMDDELNRQRVDEVLAMSHNFFTKHMKTK